jgi:hypothetical protein
MLYDLGNLRNSDPNFIIPIVGEILKSGVKLILFGSGEDISSAIYESFEQVGKSYNAILMHESLSLQLSSIENLLNNKYTLNNITSILGYQMHISNPETQNQLFQAGHESQRLSEIRNKLSELEPVLRQGAFLSSNLSVIKQSDAPAQHSLSSSGLVLDDACQIARYVGFNDHVSIFNIDGYDRMLDMNGQTANAIAQMLWYFIEGFSQRKTENPRADNNLIEYVIHVKDYDFPLSFLKSELTGRWWVKIPAQPEDYISPCSYGDYQAACKDNVSNRILNIVKQSL